MARKGENIYKRKDGRYEGRYINGRKENGKSRYFSIYSYNYKDIKTKLSILKAEYLLNEININNNNHKEQTLSDWFDFWLKGMSEINIKPSTYSSYYGTIERHLKPLLGNIRLTKLTSDDLQDFLNILTEKNLKPSYINKIFMVLNSSLKKAVKLRYIFANPCEDVKLPKNTKSMITPLTVGEHKVLERAALAEDSCEIGPAVILSLYTGMRMGEICALTWEDIDFKKSIITVRRTLQRIQDTSDTGAGKTKIIFGSPKSLESMRIIPMCSKLAGYMRMYSEKSKSKFVLSCKNSFAEPRIMLYRFQKLLNKANIPSIHFHVLRHTFATRCMEFGINVTTISKILGHSSVKMTLDVYTDAVMEEKVSAMNTFERMLAM